MDERDEHLFGTTRWDNLSDSDEERELELERVHAARRQQPHRRAYGLGLVPLDIRLK